MTHPPLVHAGTLATITEKFKAIFATEKVENEETLATSQTMALFKPVIVDNTSSGVDQDPEQDSLQAVSGPLRVSTEDIDFPTTDTVSVYEVKKGDTLAAIAKLFNVSKNTIMWANNMSSEKVTPGDTLVILPITGIKHTVKKGDSLSSIAKKYKADADDVAKYNGLSKDNDLAVGDIVLVPEGEISVAQVATPSKNK